MSRFSGKCDFYDEIEIFGLDSILASTVCLNGQDEPLKLTCLEDCIPYYPHIVPCAYHNNVDRVHTIYLTSKSWVDLEEERYGKLRAHDFYRRELREEMERHGLLPKC